MRAFKVPGGTPLPTAGIQPGEKKKLILMSVALALVIVGVVYSSMKANRERDKAAADLPGAGEGLIEEVVLPEIDAAALEAGVSDADQSARVVLERKPLGTLMGIAETLTPGHFEAMQATILGSDLSAEILAEPGPFRGKAFLARGWIDNLEQRRREVGGRTYTLGRLLLEDESAAYFATAEFPTSLSIGSFARVDGLFLKVYSDESAEKPGNWIEAPLLVGPTAIRSHASFGSVTALIPGRMQELEDDSLALVGTAGLRVTGLPFEALWHVMAFARDHGEDAIDWDAAPELDRTLLATIAADGSGWHGRPATVPLSRLQGVRVRRAPENPARIERFTEGWIGNMNWNHVVHFRAPFEWEDLRLRGYVEARGVFFKNFAYESSQKGLQMAPVFILTDVTSRTPGTDPFFEQMTVWVTIGAVLLSILLIFLVARDRRTSRELQEKLIQRRRDRRAKAKGSQPSTT